MLVALVDIFLTVLYARSGTSLLSGRLHRWTWRLFRRTALSWAPRKDQLLAFAGPVLLLLTVVLWMVLLSLGFSLIIWPALGAGVEAPTGETPTDFAAVLYYAGYNLTTLGTGDLVPQTGAYRLLSVFMAAPAFRSSPSCSPFLPRFTVRWCGATPLRWGFITAPRARRTRPCCSRGCFLTASRRTPGRS